MTTKPGLNLNDYHNLQQQVTTIRQTMRSAASVVKLVICCALTWILLLNFAHCHDQTIGSRRNEQLPQVDDSSSVLSDPKIWDPSSLYKATELAYGQHAIRRRRKRAATHLSNEERSQSNMIDACHSKMEVLTPYYVTNSKGKLRTIVNTELMQQAIQVETCLRSTSGETGKCNSQPECGCEQKYKWHRLLVQDPRDSGASRGVFMDWFLFPSTCVCRCRVSANSGARHLLRAISRSYPNGGVSEKTL